MPVLINQGKNPLQAAWLFYTPRALVEDLRALIAQKGYQFGVLDVTPTGGAVKDQVDVQLVLDTQDVPLPETPADALAEEPSGEPADTLAAELVGVLPGKPAGQAGKADGAETFEEIPAATGDQAEALRSAALAYQERLREAGRALLQSKTAERIIIGRSTNEAARRYLQPQDMNGGYWLISLPGLPQLMDSVAELFASSPGLRWIVWSIDTQGVLRMAPAKEVKPVAGNILRARL